ncbi:MAG TPA: ABC transporter permease subunit [Candidatus Dormibacteraeota bacterium]|nr:ABC transporter permease subunit [Candidatus Dormibacteraeota bacterium]
MIRAVTIARRDLMALFVSPAGWAVAALFVLLTSAFGFVVPVLAGQAATMDGVFAIITSFLLPVLVPVLTMRSFAEERSDGTLELLLTSPVRDWEVAGGKWLGALAFYILLLGTTLLYVVLLAVYVPGHLGSLDLGLIAATYVGLLLAGGAATAIGVFASGLTQNQIVSFFLALAILLLTWYAGTVLGFFTAPPANAVFQYAGGSNRFQSFSLGQVTLKDTVYFLSLAIAALFLTTRLLDSRRWR